MIDREQALHLAWNHIGEDRRAPRKWIIVENLTRERPWGWVFHHTSKMWHETDDFKHAVAGNAPFFVLRADGNIIETCTAYPIEECIFNYETFGSPFPPPDDRRLEFDLRRLLGEGKREAAVALYRERTGVGILDATNAVGRLMKFEGEDQGP